MPHWIRFEKDGLAQFGTLEGDTIHVHLGDMFGVTLAASRTIPLAEARVLAPCVPSKIIALWNNFHQLAAKLNVAEPPEPLYLLKAPSSVTVPGATVARPASYDGPIVYEGELGIVIGRRCANASEKQAANAIFGYTCVNDITAGDIISRNATFAQWVRAKSFDGFGPFGPVIATGLDPGALVVKTVLNGNERQNYPIADMIFPPHRLVSLISQDMTLLPGDLICCGTSLGVGAMKDLHNDVSVSIEGIGTLSNRLVQ
jgi:2-keto-4-pentenoate hydratase/2-oxohepta-3-ene-1,7-dioic acid hydratase in catechol pathway